MSTEPRFFIVGTKYAREDDMLPCMVSHGVVSTGFVGDVDLSQLVGMTYTDALASIKHRLPNEKSVAKRTLAHFVSLRPGDVIALKAHSAPLGKQARLVIARYAVVRGSKRPRYRLIEELGHSIEVDFLCEQEPIELPYGYGQTVHEIEAAARIASIFGAYQQAANEAAQPQRELPHKATHLSTISSRGEYIMTRAHNELQNALRVRLEKLFGASAVRQEQDNIDLSVTLPGKFILFEVKASPSPVTCLREALGQMLHYASRLSPQPSQIEFVVVGPSCPAPPDDLYFAYIRKLTNLPLIYCTPTTYVRPKQYP